MSAALRAVIAIAVPVCVGGAVSVPVASADESVIHQLGTPAQLVNGDVVQAWTITNLKPSTDSIPYPVAGTLWEAAATDVAVNGTVQPVVSNLKARAHSGQTYWVLFGVATPQGVNPATLSQGQQTTGKVYFDVTGDVPDSVVYNAGGPDLVVWVQPPPSSTPQNASSGSATPSGAMTGGATASTPAVPGSQGTPAAPGSTGTPVVPGSAGTPVVPGSQGTPAAPGSAGTPVVPGNAGTPVVPGSQGTPVPAITSTPVTSAAAPSPTSSCSSGDANCSPSPDNAAATPATTVAPS
ncbi:Immunogenic protein MPT63 [Mycobacterium pseudokansasii]|uniref:Immunogenic protein MPT63 n=1 Tax=Mycobacterium pseudokansasii TaxID=2341080 RepID=A0A498R6N0_9MYCO|nr:Immunogenic protein MPT63 [Mycobacterium pseudokansasii]